ncbi:hypothetical protein LPAF129_17520 [Ligilactobacillus pabuli]|uniref:Uncharacterized protein n=1 Tax=Ligilactobacillus pabuli TaxID=2886039 RepID=A0ABQ5JJF2_9LACO|nr:hypothetical protein [Ligilactobacillus pabuli]GKS82066.1 hypothetical protein LPAF129_17520 [Ligilactobacillus pabuli]HIW88625.1 hypothetical protein [Candidatus Ligilactobacillus excrementipullorum]
MRKLMTNSFVWTILLFLIFRILLEQLGGGRDGNLLVLVAVPLVVLGLMVQILKTILTSISQK